MEKLSLRKQLTIIRLYLSGYSFDEIAAQAGVSKGSVANVIADLKAGRMLIRLLFRLGCRISEVLALKVEDVDFEQGTVTIEHLKARLRLFCPNCNGRLGKTHAFCPRCGGNVDIALT